MAENPSQAINRSSTPRGTYCFALDQRDGSEDPSPMRVNRNNTRLFCRDAVDHVKCSCGLTSPDCLRLDQSAIHSARWETNSSAVALSVVALTLTSLVKPRVDLNPPASSQFPRTASMRPKCNPT